MSETAVTMAGTTDVNRIEAPVTFRAYLLCAFAAFGGVFFGYDAGYINGVLPMKYFIHEFTGKPYPGPNASPEELAAFSIPASKQSLIVSILSCGTFFGSIFAGDAADYFGRRTTIIASCIVFGIGAILQTASTSYPLLVAGRLIAGFGVGAGSAIVVLYISEVAPRKLRGPLVSGYQFCVSFGLMISSCVVYGTQNYENSGSYRIPIALQLLWGLILAVGLVFLPETPRYFVKRGSLDKAAIALARLRGQHPDSDYIQQELAEIVANYQHETRLVPKVGYLASWTNCFRGSIFEPWSNLRRTILGIMLQMFQQCTGINFIFFFGTSFFTQLKTISNPFLVSLILTLVNVFSTPISFYIIEKFGRRPLLIWGALGMTVSQLIIAIAGTVDGHSPTTAKAEIAFICSYILFFATTWGPGTWVLCGEIFPLPIRSRGVALSTASLWLWVCIVSVITPYLIGADQANLGPKVFFLWGGFCACAFVWAYFMVPETKGLTLEQVDRMLEETTPRTSSKWVPKSTYAAEMGLVADSDLKTGAVSQMEVKV